MTTSDLSRLGTTVAVWAHPDDETYLSGGLTAALRDLGQRVVWVTATRGEAGGPDTSAAGREALGVLRTRELEDAMAVLGVVEHHWLDYEDGGCDAADPAKAVARLTGILTDIEPDTVLTFGPDGVTGHPDHKTVGAWADRAVAGLACSPRLLHAVTTPEDRDVDPALDNDFDVFYLGQPRVCGPQEVELRMELTGELLERKVRALRCQDSQTAGLVGAVGLDRFRAWVAAETFALPAS
jgi:LmbE family N-acetylglucosaminyl deacetylase